MNARCYELIKKVPFTTAWYLEVYDRVYEKWFEAEKEKVDADFNTKKWHNATKDSHKYMMLMDFVKYRIMQKRFDLTVGITNDVESSMKAEEKGKSLHELKQKYLYSFLRKSGIMKS